MNWKTTLALFVWLVQVRSAAAGASINDSNTLIEDLLTGYNTNTRPADDQSSPVNVTVQLVMKSIQDFNELLGLFSITGSLIVNWKDPSLMWTPSQYGGLERVMIPYNSVWFPELILSSAASSSNTVTQSWNKVTIEYTGNVTLMASNLIMSKCDVNVKNFPFDVQLCDISFYCPSFTENELILISEVSEVNLDLLDPNVLWEVMGSVITKTTLDTGQSELCFGIRMKRKAAGVITTVLLPILMLGMLNGFVFLLVAESGERIGYCITTLLAIAVYMTIVADMLPQSADPVPVICFKLMVDMILSTLIVLVTILNLRVFNKPADEPVPKWLTSLYFRLKCTGCRKKRPTSIMVLPAKTETSPTKKNTLMDSKQKTFYNGNTDKPEDPTWQDISRLIDWVSFFGFNMGTMISFGIFVLSTFMADS